MFRGDGQPTDESDSVLDVLRRSGLPLGFKGGQADDKDNHLCCVVYRIDPVTRYQFVVATAGLRDPSPMFGPFVHNDIRLIPKPKTKNEKPDRSNEYGFPAREGTYRFKSWSGGTPEPQWVAWLSCRKEGKKDWKTYKRQFKRSVYPWLKLLLENDDDGPLFPRLWDRERQAESNLQLALLSFDPMGSVDDLVSALKLGMRSTLDGQPRNLQHRPQRGLRHVGIYLKTGDTWRLRGSSDSALPEEINETSPPSRETASTPGEGDADRLEDDADGANVGQDTGASEPVRRKGIFTATAESTRSILLSPHASTDWYNAARRQDWSERLCRGDRSGRLHALSSSPRFAGAIVAPILYPYDRSRTIGIVLVVAEDTEPLVPADVFLITRLAMAAGEHLAPRLPIPGYASWPELRATSDRPPIVRLGRPHYEAASTASRPPPCERDCALLIERMMPDGVEIELEPMVDGVSGARVFRVDPRSKYDRVEIPRALKVGPTEVIVEEFVNYHHYVRNTAVGQASRVESVLVDEDKQLGAILYTFVGSGDRIEPWTTWARSAPPAVLQGRIHRLVDKLMSWYSLARPSSRGLLETLIFEEFLGDPASSKPSYFEDKVEKAEELLNSRFESPKLGEVLKCLGDVKRDAIRDLPMDVSVVHGDLHAGNVMSIMEVDKTDVIDVAVIDWGLTTDRGYRMLDLAKLAVDLLFVHCWPSSDDEADLARWADVCEALESELTALAGGDEGWRVAYIHYLVKMLFYVNDDRTTHMPKDARKAAFKELQAMCEALVRYTNKPPGDGEERGGEPAAGTVSLHADDAGDPPAEDRAALDDGSPSVVQTDDARPDDADEISGGPGPQDAQQIEPPGPAANENDGDDARFPSLGAAVLRGDGGGEG